MNRSLTIALWSALALPTAALASTVDFTTGPVNIDKPGEWNITAGVGPISLDLHGAEATFIVKFGGPNTDIRQIAGNRMGNGVPFSTGGGNWGLGNNFARCGSGEAPALNFNFCGEIRGGTLEITNPADTAVLYNGTLSSGTLREFILSPSPTNVSTPGRNFGLLSIVGANGTGGALLGAGCLGPETFSACPTNLQTEGGAFTLSINKGANSLFQTAGVNHNIIIGEGTEPATGDDIVRIHPPAVIPEPNTLVLLGTGLIGLATAARRKLRI